MSTFERINDLFSSEFLLLIFLSNERFQEASLKKEKKKIPSEISFNKLELLCSIINSEKCSLKFFSSFSPGLEKGYEISIENFLEGESCF